MTDLEKIEMASKLYGELKAEVIDKMRLMMFSLADSWEKDARQYGRQVDEARAAGTPWAGMLSMKTALEQCAKELREKSKL